MLDLDKRSITYLPGVGPKKADILQKEAGISSYEDLLFYFPYKYLAFKVMLFIQVTYNYDRIVTVFSGIGKYRRVVCFKRNKFSFNKNAFSPVFKFH